MQPPTLSMLFFTSKVGSIKSIPSGASWLFVMCTALVMLGLLLQNE
jgi:hypothetical protein